MLAIPYDHYRIASINSQIDQGGLRRGCDDLGGIEGREVEYGENHRGCRQHTET